MAEIFLRFQLGGMLALSVAFLAMTSAKADVSLDALEALDICTQESFNDPVSPCYGLEDVLRPTTLKESLIVQDTTAPEPVPVLKEAVAPEVEAPSCDSKRGNSFVVQEGYLSTEIQRFAEFCGWKAIWKARRNNRVLDWRVVVPYTVTFKTIAEGMEKIIGPYRGVIGADVYVDVEVVVVSVSLDRS